MDTIKDTSPFLLSSYSFDDDSLIADAPLFTRVKVKKQTTTPPSPKFSDIIEVADDSSSDVQKNLDKSIELIELDEDQLKITCNVSAGSARSAGSTGSTGLSQDFTEIRIKSPTTDWIELEDYDDDDLRPLPKGLGIQISSTPFVSTKGLLSRSKKKSLSGKKVTKLKGSTKTKAPPRSRQNLFADPYESEPEPEPAAIFRVAIRQQADAISHITARISNSINELIRSELPKLHEAEKKMTIKVLEDDFELLPSVTWTASPSLVEMIKSVKDVTGAVRVLPNAVLDQVVILVQATLLHECVAKFLEMGGAGDEVDDEVNIIEEDEEDLDLFSLVSKVTRKLATLNVTIVIYGLESYLKTQRSRANTNFRRQLKEQMASEANAATGTTVARRRKKKTTSKDVDTEPSCELTLDNIELCLVDCRMRFYYGEAGPGPGDQKTHFTVQYAENGEELAGVLWRYSRALAEQVWRLSRARSGCVDFFAHNNLMSSIDPGESVQSRRDLWQRQLQQFPNISAQVSEHIVEKFPTPKLLSIALRQAADPVAFLSRIGTGTSRKTVGDELAGKIVTFMMTTNPDQVLKSTSSK